MAELAAVSDAGVSSFQYYAHYHDDRHHDNHHNHQQQQLSSVYSDWAMTSSPEHQQHASCNKSL